MTAPEVFMADELTRAVASFGLVGARRDMPADPLDHDRWEALLAQVKFHKLQGLLAEAVASGALPASPEQVAEALGAHAAAMEQCLLLEADMLSVAASLEREGVDLRVLKGPSFAHLDYPDAAQRVFGDIDLLVRSAQYEVTGRILSAAGYHRRFEELRPGFDRRWGKGANYSRAADQPSIDLHRTFVMGPFGLALRLDDVWERSEAFVLAGRSFLALEAEQRFLHACFHAAIGNARTRLTPLRDLAGMLQRTERPLDLDRVRTLSARWQSDAVLARAVRLAWDAFGLEETELSTWAGARPPTAAEARSLRTYLDPGMGYAARSFAALAFVPGWRQKAEFAWALALPDRTYDPGRHGGQVRRWGRAVRQIASLYRRRRD